MTTDTHAVYSELDRVEETFSTAMHLIHGLEDAVFWWTGREEGVDGPGDHTPDLTAAALMLEPAVAHMEKALQRLRLLMRDLGPASAGDAR